MNGKKSNFLIGMVEAQIGEAYDTFNRELKARVKSLYPGHDGGTHEMKLGADVAPNNLR